MRRRRLLCLLLLGWLLPATSSAAVMARLPRQGTVVFLGDSITWQNHFLVFLEAHLRRRHPSWSLRLLNRGVRGDTVPRALLRLERDVIAPSPALVVILLGMNDGGYRGLDRPRLRRYRADLTLLVQRIRARSKAAIVLVTPTAVNPPQQRYNTMLAAMAKVVKEVAAAQGTGLVDLFSPFRQLLLQARQHRPPLQLMADDIHPNPAGHLLLADLLLQQLHPCPAPGALRLTLDARQRGALTVRGTNVFLPPAARPALALLPASRRRVLLGWPRLQLQKQAQAGWLLFRCGNASFSLSPRAGRPAELFSSDGDQVPWVAAAARLHRLLVERWRWQYALWDPKARGVQRLTGGQSPKEARAALSRVEESLAGVDPAAYRCRVQLLVGPGDRPLHPVE